MIVASLMAIIFALSLFGNLLTCYVIYDDKTMHTTTNYYLFNLAISDVTLTFAIMFELAGDVYFTYSPSEWVCKMQWFSVTCLWNNTVLTMTALAIERYKAIVHPLNIKSNPSIMKKRVMKVIALLWTVAIILTLPEMLIVTLRKYRQTIACFVIPTPLARILNGVLAIVTFFIPLIIMIFVYSMIIYKVNTRQKNLGHRNVTKKMNTLIAGLMVSFLICWTPYFVERTLLAVLHPNQLLKLAEWWSLLVRLVIINSWLSVILNPLIFSLVSTKFRKALKNLWNSKIRRNSNTTLHHIGFMQQ
ncbi:neuromedin-U receptor 2-like [Leguminivora glycinivorella]|uniref:neuromedin-U receptor 2-like n=1 Tax=Leguminivora glycinivorella TaxID=1035111 RepID=UPI00200E32C5|nr:neuromedin-U receptor 2-like [Leguminivora glycinivorella]